VKSVIIAAPISESFSLFLTSRFECHTIKDKSGLLNISSDEVIGIVTSNKLKLDAPLLENFQSLSWIARLGSGLEIIDLNYCEQHQIHCFSSPQGIANSVAEHATGMLLSLRHHIHSSFYEVKNRAWIRDANRGYGRVEPFFIQNEFKASFPAINEYSLTERNVGLRLAYLMSYVSPQERFGRIGLLGAIGLDVQASDEDVSYDLRAPDYKITLPKRKTFTPYWELGGSFQF
jgi:lactate dehydrogenase-like 2-hydroxyacid dehydrogenase